MKTIRFCCPKRPEGTSSSLGKVGKVSVRVNQARRAYSPSIGAMTRKYASTITPSTIRYQPKHLKS